MFSHIKQIKEEPNSIFKNQLHSKSSALTSARERTDSQAKKQRIYNVPTQYSIIQQTQLPMPANQGTRQLPSSSTYEQKIIKLRSKIEQVIDLCKQNQYFREIQQAEKQVLNYLAESSRKRLENLKSRQKKINRKSSNKKISKQEHIGLQNTNFSQNEIVKIISNIQAKAINQIQELSQCNRELLRIAQSQSRHRKNNKRKKQFKQPRRPQKLLKKTSTGRFNTDEELDSQVYVKRSRSKSPIEKIKQEQPNQGLIYQRNKKSFAHQAKATTRRRIESFPHLQVQSGHYLENIESSPKIVVTNSNIQKLQKNGQNFYSKNEGIQTIPSFNTNQRKQWLKNEIVSLNGKISYYQDMLSTKRQQDMYPQQFNGSEIENLMLQGANIAAEGRRLIKVRSNPNLSSVHENINQNSKQRLIISHQPVNLDSRQLVSGFGNEYEKIIRNMRAAAKS